MEQTLKQQYEQICNSYLKQFCENYELQYEKDAWIGREIGEYVDICDMVLDFGVIRYCVDNDCKDYEELLRWYDHTLECHELSLSYPNFPAWCAGCPRISDEELANIRNLKKSLEDAVKSYNEQAKF